MNNYDSRFSRYFIERERAGPSSISEIGLCKMLNQKEMRTLGYIFFDG